MTGRPGRMAWASVLLVLASWLVAAVAAGAGLAPQAGSTTTDPGSLGAPGDGPVVVVGVPGLTWDLIDAETTPALHALAADGGSAALVLRGTHEVTCAADAWLTLGAGQRAATNVEGCRDAEFDGGPAADRPAPVLPDEIVTAEGEGAQVALAAAWDRWERRGQGRSLVPELGTLATAAAAAGSCVAAYDPLAALGAADADGRVAAYLPERSGVLPGELAPGCAVHLITTPSVTTPDREVLTAHPDAADEIVVDGATLAKVDTAVGALADRLPDGASLLVAGLGHPRDQAVATALVVHPVDPAGGATLTSGSTNQRGLVQLTDLTPTVLLQAGLADADALPDALAGAPVTADGAANGDPVALARDRAAAVSGAKVLAPVVLGVLAVLAAPFLVLALIRRGRLLAVVGTFGMAVPVATWLAGLVPWWRADRPSVALTLAVAGAAALVTAVAWAGPWRRRALGPVAVVAAVTLAVIGADTLCSSRLGLVSVLGLQPVTAGRFYGQGNVGFGTVLGAFLVLAGAVLTWLRQDRRATVLSPVSSPVGTHEAGPQRSVHAAVAILLLGGNLTLVNAAPSGGADFGGVPAMVVATGLLVLSALGLRWRARSLLALAVLGVVVAGAVMVLDWLRGPERRTHLGAFVQQVIDGEALGIVTRKLDQSLGILLSYPLSWVAVLALVLVAIVVIRRPRWSSALWGHDGLYPAALAGVVAMVLGWVLNDSGIAVVALALTMLIGAALGVMGRSVRADVARAGPAIHFPVTDERSSA